MERYENGKIYKLVNNVDDSFYVGSTCLSLAKRMYSHRSHAKIKTSPVYQHLKSVGMDNVDRRIPL